MFVQQILKVVVLENWSKMYFISWNLNYYKSIILAPCSKHSNIFLCFSHMFDRWFYNFYSGANRLFGEQAAVHRWRILILICAKFSLILFRNQLFLSFAFCLQGESKIWHIVPDDLAKGAVQGDYKGGFVRELNGSYEGEVGFHCMAGFFS